MFAAVCHPLAQGRPGANGVKAVLDLACGMGGDLKKFWNFPDLQRYVGMDIAKERLRELAKRFNKMGRRHPPVQVREQRGAAARTASISCLVWVFALPGGQGGSYYILAAALTQSRFRTCAACHRPCCGAQTWAQ